jgi:hypothetical protein
MADHHHASVACRMGRHLHRARLDAAGSTERPEDPRPVGDGHLLHYIRPVGQKDMSQSHRVPIVAADRPAVRIVWQLAGSWSGVTDPDRSVRLAPPYEADDGATQQPDSSHQEKTELDQITIRHDREILPATMRAPCIDRGAVV